MRQMLSDVPKLKSVLVLVVFAIVAAACGSDDSGTAETTAFATSDTLRADVGEDGEFEFGDEAEAPAAEQGALGSGGTGTDPLATVDFGRDIIFTAQLTVAVSDVAAASTEATDTIQSLGGFVFGQQTIGGGEARSTLVFKIAPESFQAALAALGSIGEVRTQNVTADDVTDRVVDLRSRISTAEASVERLKEFLANAGDIDTIAELENQLLDRETTLEVLRGQIRTLEDAVSLATITVTLTEALSNPAMQVQVTAYPGADDNGASCPGNPEISVLEGEQVTVCFEILNTGDTLLTGFTLRDAVLGVDIEDLTVVWGVLDSNLEPGQTLVLATTLPLDRTLRSQTRITAIPVNEDGQRVEAREVAGTTALFLGANDPGGIPGFQDGVDKSWDFLKDLGGVIVLLAGLALPFIWVIPLFVIYHFWRKRKLAQLKPPVESPETIDVDSSSS